MRCGTRSARCGTRCTCRRGASGTSCNRRDCAKYRVPRDPRATMVRPMRTLLVGLVLLSSCAKKNAGYTVTGTAELSSVHEVSKIAAKFDLTEVNGEKDVEVKGTVTGMEPGTYVLHFHQPMGCDPMAAHPSDLHISDLGSIQADATGSAKVTFTIKNARLGGM